MTHTDSLLSGVQGSVFNLSKSVYQLNLEQLEMDVRRSAFRQTCLLVCSLVCSALVVSPVAAQQEQPAAKPPGRVALFDLDTPITDRPMADDPLFGDVGGEALRSLIERMKKASADDDVAALVLLYGTRSLGTAQVQELATVIRQIAAKKPVYAHGDSLSTATYATISGASRISLSPTGDAWVNGLYGEQMYLRGLLDLVSVQPEFLTCGDYKSAAETFMRRGPSDEASAMNTWLYDGIFSGLKATIAAGRQVDEAQVEQWINQGLYSAESAHAAKLTDAVETRDDLTAFIKKTHGVTIKFDRRYGKKSATEIDLNNPLAVFQLWAQLLGGPQQRRSTKDAVAIVHIDGPIMLGKKTVSPFGATEGAYSEEIRRTLAKLAVEPRVRGVVIRVNSPGGSATASEIMLQAIQELQKKKPVVVSMGNYAASGGYYVSARASKIYANPNTITGSIGVVAGKLATDQMWKRIGVNFEPIQRGDKAGILYSSKPFQNGEREELQAWMDSIYEVFKDHVVQGRGERLQKPIDEIAGGRVYTGAQALELGLVDELGTLDDAVEHLIAELKLENYEIRSYPESKNFLESLLEDLGPPKEPDDKRISVGIWSAVEPSLRHLDPVRVEMIQQALQQLDFLSQERVMLTAPVIRFW